MGNKTKIALSSAFACTMALGLIGCNKTPDKPIPSELGVSFVSNKLELDSNVTKVSSDQDLSLKIKLPALAKDTGYRLPRAVDEGSNVKVSTGNQILIYEKDYNYVVDASKDFATLSIPHTSYQGDISISANAVSVVTFSDPKLSVSAIDTTGEETNIRIVSNDASFIAPIHIDSIKLNGENLSEDDFDYEPATAAVPTGDLVIYHQDGLIPESIVITAAAYQIGADTIPVTFHGDEIGWDVETTGFSNRTYLADIKFENDPTAIETKDWSGETDITVHQNVDRHSDMVATISLNDWTGYVGDLPMNNYKKDFNYSHEFSDARDVEGSLLHFAVVGVKDGKQEVIKSTLYTYVLSDHGRTATFKMDQALVNQYASLDITCNPYQVANNVFVNFGELNDNLSFNRHAYAYETYVPGEEDFKGKIILDKSDDRKLPKGEGAEFDNSRVKLFWAECGNDDDEPVEITDGFTYKVTDGDDRHEAEIVIDRETVPYGEDRSQKDLLIKIDLVDSYVVEFEGDKTHINFHEEEQHVAPQDEDLNVHMNIWDVNDTDHPTDALRSFLLDYANTFRLPNEEDGVTKVVGYSEAHPEGVALNFTYTIDPDTKVATLNVPQEEIAQCQRVVVTSYAIRTNFLAMAPLDADTGEVSTLVQYPTRRGDYLNSILVPVDENRNDIHVDFEIIPERKGSDPWPKLTSNSVKEARYGYTGNDQHLEPSDPVSHTGDDLEFVVAPETTGHYKDYGTLTVAYPTDTSTDPFPYDNEDEILTFFVTTDSLMHDVTVTDGPDYSGNHYTVTNMNGEPQPTGESRWLEPIGDDDELRFKVELKDKEGYKLPESAAAEVYIRNEITGEFEDIHLYGDVNSSRDDENKWIIVTIHKDTEHAGKHLHSCAGDIWLDMWTPLPA